MKKLSLFIFLLFVIAGTGNAQSITGEWHWQNFIASFRFNLTLKKAGSNRITGSYCGVTPNNREAHCKKFEDKSTISLTKKGPNVYKGTIRSNFNSKKGKIKIRYNPSNDTIVFKRIKFPEGKSYIPNKITLHRKSASEASSVKAGQ